MRAVVPFLLAMSPLVVRMAGVGVFAGDDDEDAAAEAGFVCLAQAGDAVDDAAVG